MVLLLPTFMLSLRMVTSVFSISSLIRIIKNFNTVKPSIEVEQISFNRKKILKVILIEWKND